MNGSFNLNRHRVLNGRVPERERHVLARRRHHNAGRATSGDPESARFRVRVLVEEKGVARIVVRGTVRGVVVRKLLKLSRRGGDQLDGCDGLSRCGIAFDDYNDFQVGDVVEAYDRELVS